MKVYIFIHNILLKYLKNALFYFLLCLLAWFLDRFPPSRPDWSLTFSPPCIRLQSTPSSVVKKVSFLKQTNLPPRVVCVVLYDVIATHFLLSREKNLDSLNISHINENFRRMYFHFLFVPLDLVC